MASCSRMRVTRHRVWSRSRAVAVYWARNLRLGTRQRVQFAKKGVLRLAALGHWDINSCIYLIVFFGWQGKDWRNSRGASWDASCELQKKAGDDIIQFLRNIYSFFSFLFQIHSVLLVPSCLAKRARCRAPWPLRQVLLGRQWPGAKSSILWRRTTFASMSPGGESLWNDWRPEFRMNFMNQGFLGRKGLGVQVSDLFFSWEFLPKQNTLHAVRPSTLASFCPWQHNGSCWRLSAELWVYIARIWIIGRWQRTRVRCAMIMDAGEVSQTVLLEDVALESCRGGCRWNMSLKGVDVVVPVNGSSWG